MFIFPYQKQELSLCLCVLHVQRIVTPLYCKKLENKESLNLREPGRANQ